MLPILVTSNAKKRREIRLALGMKVRAASLNLPEIQSTDESAVAIDKAKRAYRLTKQPVIVEDIGLHLSCLNGFPGALIKQLIEAAGVEGVPAIASKLKNRRAWAGIAVVFHDGRTTKVFKKKVYGTIAIAPHKNPTYSFGWNTVFVPRGSTKTLAEMPMSALVVRGEVYSKLKRWLLKNNQTLHT
jgi:non-canonical purine NTP pyrophosphatase (RdgB/HAM1 family)